MEYDAGSNFFHDFSLAECLAYVHRKWGELGLRQVLDGYGGTIERLPGRELLEDAVHELEQLDLGKVASIVAEYAAKRPSKYDGKTFLFGINLVSP